MYRMKKIISFLLCIALLTSCGNGKSARQVAEEICDCSKKANALPVSDPTRSQAQAECVQQQQMEWDKLKNDPEKAKTFNDVIGKCADEQIRKSLGQ